MTKTTRRGRQRPFETAAAVLGEGDYKGAKFGAFNPGEIAASLLGGASYGTLAVYCLRRFGPPNSPSDPDKTVASWLLTTPMPDLFLEVSIAPQPARLLFAYVAQADLWTRLLRLRMAQERKKDQRFTAWRRKTYGIDAPGHQVGAGLEERQRFHRIAEAWLRGFNRTPQEKAAAKRAARHGLLVRGERALRAAILDLKRPVPVRDVLIACAGRTESRAMAPAEPFHGAGVTVPLDWYDDLDALAEFGAAVHALGPGTEGLKRATALLKAAGGPR